MRPPAARSGDAAPTHPHAPLPFQGPHSAEDHVIVSNEYFQKLDPPGWQEKNMVCASPRTPTKQTRSTALFPILPAAAHPSLPPSRSAQLRDQIEEDLAPNSRLASYVVLSKELDGISVIVPASNPDLTNYV